MTNDHSANGSRLSTLDRRREKAQTAKSKADAARQRVEALDDQLAANAGRSKEDQTALQQAVDEVSRRKRALKDSAKQHQRLSAALKKAQASAAKARRKRFVAEDKYDKAVLADLVRRERSRDLAAHPQSTAKPAPDRAAPPTDPAPEQPTLAASTAVDTAARSTAEKADAPSSS